MLVLRNGSCVLITGRTFYRQFLLSRSRGTSGRQLATTVTMHRSRTQPGFHSSSSLPPTSGPRHPRKDYQTFLSLRPDVTRSSVSTAFACTTRRFSHHHLAIPTLFHGHLGTVITSDPAPPPAPPEVAQPPVEFREADPPLRRKKTSRCRQQRVPGTSRKCPPSVEDLSDRPEKIQVVSSIPK